MKKYKNILGSFVMASVALAMVGCDDKNINEDYKPATMSSEEAYFPNTEKTTYNLTEDANYVNVAVYRGSGKGTLTVPIYVEAMEEYEMPDLYTFSESVTFEDGETVAYFKIGYDYDSAEYEDEQQYQLTLDEAFTTPYGQDVIIITLVKPAPYRLLGKGKYSDEFWGMSNVSVNIYQNEIDGNFFRIQNPYYIFAMEEEDDFDPDYSEDMFEVYILQVGEEYYGQVIKDPDMVGYNEYGTYMSEVEGQVLEFYIEFPGAFTRFTYDDWKYNKVAAWQSPKEIDGEMVTLPGEITIAPVYYAPDYDWKDGNYGAVWDNTGAPIISILFPGYQKLKTTIALEYLGMLTDPNGKLLAAANVNMGKDLTKVVLGVGQGGAESVNSISTAMLEGDIATVSLNSTGEAKIPFSSSYTAGTYTIVALGYVGDELFTTQYLSFEFYGAGGSPNDGWNSLGYAEYTDGYMVTSFNIYNSLGLITYDVELQENEETPGLYRLVNPYGEVFPLNEPGDYLSGNYYLYIDATNPERIFIPYCKQAINWDGQLGCYSVAGYYLDYGLSPEEIDEQAEKDGFGTVWGTLQDGIITFEALTLLSTFDEDGYYDANAIFVQNTAPYYLMANGEFVAPFRLDMSNLTSTSSQSVFNTSRSSSSNRFFKTAKKSAVNLKTLSTSDRDLKRSIKPQKLSKK